MAPRLLVVGSIALDTLESERGVVRDELGGSALYFALAASLLEPVAVCGAVGDDALEELRRVVDGKEIDASLVSRLDAPTYRWHARHAHGGNVDLGSKDVIYDAWEPELPTDFDGWAFIGSMRPRIQAETAQRLGTADLLAGDAMQSYASSALLHVEDLVEQCDWFFCNSGELQLLAPGVSAEDFREQRSLEGLCLKSGPDGSSLYVDQGLISMPALHRHPVVDTTGAGDALAGGFLARWLQLERRHDALREALAYGIACASLTIEDVGLRSLSRATKRDLEDRVMELAS